MTPSVGRPDSELRSVRAALSREADRLPCGALGYPDECGIRCLACFSIAGSLGSPCAPRPLAQEG